MADLHILREHTLGLAGARKIAFAWAEQAEAEFGMECTYEEGRSSDIVRFERTGVNGTLEVSKNRFELDAKLGFLLGAFKEKIEAEIVKNLDALLSPKALTKAASGAKKKSP
jgi:putative polyhydroxyalkanoate system protein